MKATYKMDSFLRFSVYFSSGFLCAWIVILAMVLQVYELLLFLPLLTVGAAFNLFMFPAVWLQEDGVFVRYVFKKRRYAWSDVLQVGIALRVRRGIEDYELIVVKPGGSRRGQNDKGFFARNFGMLISIRKFTPEILKFVTTHYGPLDFDTSGENRM